MSVTAPDLVAAQRHTVRTLVATQAIGGLGLGAAISVGALLAKDVTGSDGLSGLAQTAQTLGAAVVAAVLIPFVPAGVPVLAAAVVAVVVGLTNWLGAKA